MASEDEVFEKAYANEIDVTNVECDGGLCRGVYNQYGELPMVSWKDCHRQAMCDVQNHVAALSVAIATAPVPKVS